VRVGDLRAMMMTSIGPLYLALLGALVFLPRRPPAAALTLWLLLPLWLWWFYSMQLSRYLLPSLVFAAPAAGYAASRCLRSGPILRLATVSALGLWSAAAVAIAALITVPALPVIFGTQSRVEYLLRNLDVYEPSLYIAANLPQDARIVTYGEPRCFYFDRDYFWGEPGHSDIIPYDTMRSPRDLVATYRRLGYTHVLINNAYFPGLMTSDGPCQTLLREGIETGLLVPVTRFPTRPGYILLEVVADGGGP